MNHSRFAPSGEKITEPPLRYEPVTQELPFLMALHPEADLPVIQL